MAQPAGWRRFPASLIMKRVLFLLWATFLVVAAAAHAELALEVPMIELKPKPGADSATVAFVFHNRGEKAVKVTTIESACSCLSVTLDKAEYAPGEKGTGVATFLVSSLTGRHEKSVHVQTNDPAQSEWVIPCVMEVPEVVRLEPKMLQWWVGDEAGTKVTRLSILGDAPMKIVSLKPYRIPAGADFSMKEITPGREYEISVTPTSTADVLLGAIMIETDSPLPLYQRQQAFYSVYRKPARP